MYPATTSLVNVVPKLSSTGRDLLQVQYSHRGSNSFMHWDAWCNPILPYFMHGLAGFFCVCRIF